MRWCRLFHRPFPQPLCIDVDDQRRQQDQAANQYLQKAVDVDVVEAVVEDPEHEQADDGVADAAAAAEQAGAADDDGGDGVEQEVSNSFCWALPK